MEREGGLERKEALDKPHSSGSCASTSPRHVNTVTQEHSSSVLTLGVSVCVHKKKQKKSPFIQVLLQFH